MKKLPQRICCACREAKDKKELLRVVRDPQGDISLDMTGKASGRGAYICCNEECLNRAKKQRSLERGLKCSIPQDIWSVLEGAIEEARK